MGEKPDEVESAGESRTCVSGDETEVRIRKSALPGTEEKRAAIVCHPLSCESVCEPQKAAAHGSGVGPAPFPSAVRTEAGSGSRIIRQLHTSGIEVIRIRDTVYSERPYVCPSLATVANGSTDFEVADGDLPRSGIN